MRLSVTPKEDRRLSSFTRLPARGAVSPIRPGTALMGALPDGHIPIATQ
jgi:hypothetical protein